MIRRVVAPTARTRRSCTFEGTESAFFDNALLLPRSLRPLCIISLIRVNYAEKSFNMRCLVNYITQLLSQSRLLCI